MKVCPNCQTKYPDDANFCPQENCATSAGPRRLEAVAETAARPRYELETQLGGSRSGEVWRARDSQTGALVAYKRVARAALPTPATFERALRELKQLQRAQGPRLARVLDFGREPDGGLFVVTELVAGQPLDRMVAGSGAFTVDRAKKIIAQIGESLLEGQKVGVVHHDLSAKNVLVGEGDEVKVINFVAPVPVTETVFGVPEYLSPEQAEGKLVDQRSNTYSLGAILTLLLSGRPPVEGADVASILGAVQRGDVAPPSRLMAGLSPEIDRIVLKAMDKSPNRRPLTLRQFLTEVSALAAPNAAAPDRAGVGFAKTMMFAGGAPEIQRLVNEARVARAGAGNNGSAAAVSTQDVVAVPAAQHTPPPQASNGTPPPQTGHPAAPAPSPRRPHGAAVAATMVALPAASPRVPAQGGSPAQAPESDPGATPPPVSQATPAPVAGGPSMAPTPKPAAGGTFRETLWFKKGDVDQMVAEARARVEAAREKSVAPPPEVVAEVAEVAPQPAAAAEDERPLEERYVDDGSVTAEDRKKFSLRTAGTSAALPTLEPVPGERMSEEEMVSEIGGGRRVGIIVVAVVVALGIGLTVALAFRHKGGEAAPSSMVPTERPPAAATAAAPAPPPPAAAPTPPPAAVPPAPPEPKPLAAKAQVDPDDDEPAAAAPKPHASTHHHAAAKKAKSGKKHH